MTDPKDVIPFLGKGEAHWREGFSAHALANTWFGKDDFPDRVRAVLDGHPAFAHARLLEGFFERETDLRDGLGKASQTDLLALVRLSSGLAVLGVEGKVEESFANVIGDQTRLSAGQRERLSRLAALLGIDAADLPPLRYQLFHRAAAAIFEADRYGAGTAMLLVHSFSQRETGFSDFAAFLAAMGIDGDIAPLTVVGPKRILGVDFYAAWVADPRPAMSAT